VGAGWLGIKYVCRSGKAGRIIVARLMPESDLLLSLRRLTEDEDLKAGVILSGVGLLRKARLRNCKVLPEEYPITDLHRSFISFEKPLEILGLSGNVSDVEGKPWVHAHITLSSVNDGKVSVIGGHLIEGCIVFGFAEIILMELENISMKKEFDEETKTLQLFVQK